MLNLKLLAKRFFFPGLDLHTRSRCRWLPRYFITGKSKTLDAGCGNGALSYEAFKRGSDVLGISFDEATNQRTALFFKPHLNRGLQFKTLNLYNLSDLEEKFDQIICSETLEHITNDRLVIKSFYNLLKPNGVLHLCCPYALHPEHNLGRISDPEDGGHVRDGYTLDTYENILAGEGFVITDQLGIGSKSLVWCDNLIRKVRNLYGDAFAVPLFLIFIPFMKFIDTQVSSMPFSLYVKAVKK